VAPNHEVLIGDEGGHHVVIRALSRNHPTLFDHRDGNWVGCELQIAAGGFRAAFRADLRSEEFQAFLVEAEVLNSALDGVASFSTIEEQIALSLVGNGRGQVRVQGVALDAPGSDNRLHFSFDIDQTDLPQICRSLESLLAAFPVVGVADA